MFNSVKGELRHLKMLTWNFVNSEQTVMYISIVFFVFIILGVKKKISKSAITKQGLSVDAQSKASPSRLVPSELQHSSASRTFPSHASIRTCITTITTTPAPTPHTSSHPGSPFLPLPPSCVHYKGHQVLRQGPFTLSFWSGSYTCDMCSFVHSCPLPHPYSIHIPHKIHKHILFPACIVIDDKNKGPYVRVCVFSWERGILGHLSL